MPIIVSAINVLTVQNIVDCAQRDAQHLIGGSHVAVIDYTNRISLDLLRHSRWRFLLSPVKSFSTVVGEDSYYIGSGAAPAGSTDVNLDIENLRSLKLDSIFDRTNHKRLHNTEETPVGTQFTQNNKPQLFRLDQDTSTVINIYPPADGVYTIEFRYYETITQLADVGDELQIPPDYKDVVCAGVSWLTAKYLKANEDASHWFSVYQSGKQQIIKDYNLHPRDGEFMGPDPVGVFQSQLTPYNPIETSIP